MKLRYANSLPLKHIDIVFVQSLQEPKLDEHGTAEDLATHGGRESTIQA